jgi:hypothetical protein
MAFGFLSLSSIFDKMVTEQEHILDFSMELFSNESHHYLDKNALFYFNLKKD